MLRVCKCSPMSRWTLRFAACDLFFLLGGGIKSVFSATLILKLHHPPSWICFYKPTAVPLLNHISKYANIQTRCILHIVRWKLVLLFDVSKNRDSPAVSACHALQSLVRCEKLWFPALVMFKSLSSGHRAKPVTQNQGQIRQNKRSGHFPMFQIQTSPVFAQHYCICKMLLIISPQSSFTETRV